MLWTWVMRAGLATAALGAAWSLSPAQDADPGFRPAVSASAFAEIWPRVVFDEGHYNVHTRMKSICWRSGCTTAAPP